ncbi:MAG: extracellular solute-binding protein [Planctomycetota bacterium]|nr:extracellular solute-binding protein [Planctomycetota bacterium]
MNLRLTIILAATLVLLLWAIASREPPAERSAEAEGKVVLRVSHFSGPINPRSPPRDISGEADQAVVNAFLARNPDVSFGTGSAIRVEGRAGESSLFMSMAGDTAGEILFVNFRSLDQFVRQGFLIPLDDFYVEWFHRESLPPDWEKIPDVRFFYDADRCAIKRTPEGWFRRNWRPRPVSGASDPPAARAAAEALLWDECDPPDPATLIEPRELKLEDIGRNPGRINIHPRVWKVIYTRSPEGERHVYTVPNDTVVMALMYRKDMFKAAGLDPEKPPGTWQELYDACMAIADPEEGVYGLALPSGAWHFMNFLWQSGSEVLEEDGQGNWRAVFDNPKAVRAFKFYRKLLNTYKRSGSREVAIARNDTDGGADFSNRKCAMRMWYVREFLILGTWHSPDQVGLAPLPLGPDGDFGAEFNSPMYGINSQVRDPKRIDAAWRYISFLNSSEARRIKTRVMVEGGYARYVHPARLREFGYESHIDEIPRLWREAAVKAFERGKPEPYGRNCQHIYQQIAKPLEAILTDPDARLKANLESGSPEDDADSEEIAGLLERAVRDTNERMLGRIPEERLRRDRIYGWFVVAAVAALFVWGGVRVVRALRTGPPAAEGFVGSRNLKFHALAWAFMAAAILSIAIWQYYPLVRGAAMAFQDYRILGGGRWVWLDNFIEMFHNSDFWMSLFNTILYVLLSLLLGFFPPVILAIMLSEVPRLKMAFRVIYYLPAVISGLVTVYLWRWFYDPSQAGLLNAILEFIDGTFGTDIAPLKWLQDPRLAMVCVIVPGIWSGLGAGSIIYLAALKSIPEELYEAADMDGAGPFQKIWHVTLPALKPLLLITLLGAFIGAFHAMENIFLFTGGGLNNRTYVMGLEIWYNAFLHLRFGYATAVAWVMGAMLIGFTVMQIRLLKEARFTRARGEGDAAA